MFLFFSAFPTSPSTQNILQLPRNGLPPSIPPFKFSLQMSILAIQSTSSSRSSSRRSLGKKISAIGARLTRTLSHPEENREEEDRYSLVSDEPPSYYNGESPSYMVHISRDCCLKACRMTLMAAGTRRSAVVVVVVGKKGETR